MVFNHFTEFEKYQQFDGIEILQLL